MEFVPKRTNILHCVYNVTPSQLSILIIHLTTIPHGYQVSFIKLRH